MKKTALLILSVLPLWSSGQQLYTNFEDIHEMWFGMSTGNLDTTSVNPAPDAVDSSMVCGKYIRDTALYDLIKMYPLSVMEDVSDYASNAFGVPKMKMKVYTSAPVGTMIGLQLGLKNDDSYPGGVHSEYQSVTMMQNAWHVVTFNFVQMGGAAASSGDVDKIVLLFNPGYTVQDTVYFDDLMAPPQVIPGIARNSPFPVRLFQNSPNPAKESTHINFQLGSSGPVSLQLYDIIGNPVKVLLEKEMKPGSYSVPVDTETLPDGIYFYALKMNGVTRSMKMIVSK